MELLTCDEKSDNTTSPSSLECKIGKNKSWLINYKLDLIAQAR